MGAVALDGHSVREVFILRSWFQQKVSYSLSDMRRSEWSNTGGVTRWGFLSQSGRWLWLCGPTLGRG